MDYVQLRQNDIHADNYRKNSSIAATVVYMMFSYAFFSHKFRKTRKNLKEYNGDLKTLHRIQELEYDAIINELEEGGREE